MLIKKLKELDKLKKLIFNEEQQVLFNFIPKQTITLPNKLEIISPEHIEKNEKENSLKFKLKQKHIQRWKSFSNVATIVKAFTKFKRLLKKNKFCMYSKLYDSYEKILCSHCANPTEKE